MAHHEHEDANLDPETKKFNFLVERGDDFMKIELYQYAIVKYREAQQIHPHDEHILIQLREAQRHFKSDNKKIAAIVFIAACIIAAVCLI
jgi:hypothetical protein